MNSTAADSLLEFPHNVGQKWDTNLTLWGRTIGYESYFVGKNSWVQKILCGEEFLDSNLTLWGRILG